MLTAHLLSIIYGANNQDMVNDAFSTLLRGPKIGPMWVQGVSNVRPSSTLRSFEMIERLTRPGDTIPASSHHKLVQTYYSVSAGI